ncbi:hypothetical protein BH11PAT4_BH11PAT4_6890 [soil metagenome]
MEQTHPTVNEHEFIAFRPAMDWWVMGIFLLVIIALIAAIPLVLWTVAIGPVASGLSVLAMVLGGIYYIDIAFYSYYVLDREQLVVTSHIRQLFFPYRTMLSLQPGGIHGLISVGSRKRFALSRRNVIIKLAKGPWKSISVSPKDKELFIQTILERIDGERSSRASRTKGGAPKHS